MDSAAELANGIESTRVLFVVSAATEMSLQGGKTLSTGYWAPEFAVPYKALIEAGHRVDIATPGGHRPTPDPISMGENPERLRGYLQGIRGLRQPMDLARVDPAIYQAIVIPGGYAPMSDLADSIAMARVLRSAIERRAVIAAICHAPAALLSVRSDDDGWPFAGYRMVSFTNAEERAWLGEKRLAWQVEDRLRKAGANFEPGGLWASKVVRDRNLLTGQNSPSCAEFTRALVDALAPQSDGGNAAPEPSHPVR